MEKKPLLLRFFSSSLLQHLVEVVRHHDVKRQPTLVRARLFSSIIDLKFFQAAPEYDWEETTNLNLVLHQFEYTVTTAVCTKTSNKHLQILKRLSTVGWRISH